MNTYRNHLNKQAGKLIILCLALFSLIGCRDEIMTYNGTEGIYFNVQWGSPWGDTTKWANQPNTHVRFVNVSGNDTVLKLRVSVTGEQKDYPRPIHISVNQDSTTALPGINFELQENNVVAAGMSYVDIPVRLLRAENIRSETLRLTLELHENEHFSLSFPNWVSIPGMWLTDEYTNSFNPALHNVYINDFVSRPEGWVGLARASDGVEAGRWGAFTLKKYFLICELLNLSYQDFSKDNMPGARQEMVQNFMVRHLVQKYNDGNPVLEEDGRLMWFMTCPWRTVVGVPYVPADTNK